METDFIKETEPMPLTNTANLTPLDSVSMGRSVTACKLATHLQNVRSVPTNMVIDLQTEEEREKHQLSPPACVPTGTEPAASTCVLTGSHTHNPS